MSEKKHPTLDTESSRVKKPLGRVALGESAIQLRSEIALSHMKEGKLPPSQGEMLARAGYDDYVIGIHQNGTSNGPEAVEKVGKNNGLPIGRQEIGKRFLFYDKAYVQEWDASEQAATDIREGYWRSEGNYRFIVAFPIHPKTRAERGVDTAQTFMSDYARTGLQPSDFFVATPEPAGTQESEGINQRYVAGYVDEEQLYHPNPNFMS